MLERTRRNVTFFFRKPQNQYFSIEKVFEEVIPNLSPNVHSTIYRLKTGTQGFLGRLKALVEAWNNKDEINHITGDITFIALALPSKKLIVTYHDLESLAQYKGWRFHLIKFFWVTIPVKRAQIVTAISEHTKQQLIAWTNCESNKIKVVSNPYFKELAYSPNEFNSKSPTILLIGTKVNKNLEGSLNAVALLETSLGLKTRLIIVGKMTRSQIALVESLNLSADNLVHVPYSKIVEAYKQSDILCFPSFYEGFGLPIVEAQVIGRCVVTSNFGAMKEVAGNGAVFVNPDEVTSIKDGLSSVVLNEDLRCNLVQNGLENSKRFNVREIARLYSDVYDFKF